MAKLKKTPKLELYKYQSDYIIHDEKTSFLENYSK